MKNICEQCEYCGQCEQCVYCEYCENCEYCGHCEYCEQCEYCKYCEQCEYCGQAAAEKAVTKVAASVMERQLEITFIFPHFTKLFSQNYV